MAKVTKEIISPLHVNEQGDTFICLDGKAFLVKENTIEEAHIMSSPGEFRNLVLALENFQVSGDGITWYNVNEPVLQNPSGSTNDIKCKILINQHQYYDGVTHGNVDANARKMDVYLGQDLVNDWKAWEDIPEQDKMEVLEKSILSRGHQRAQEVTLGGSGVDF